MIPQAYLIDPNRTNKGGSFLASRPAYLSAFLLGVTETTDIPWGHELGECLNVLVPLCKTRLADIGNKLEGINKKQLADRSEWFSLERESEDAVPHILLNTIPRIQIDMTGIDMNKATVWALRNAISFVTATIVSKTARIQQPLWMRVDDTSVPVYDQAFHYEPGNQYGGFSVTGNFADSSAATASPSSGSKFKLRRFSAR